MSRVFPAKSGISGKGVFAAEPIKKGELILVMTGKVLSGAKIDALMRRRLLRANDPFEIGNDRYIYLDQIPVLINHSCDPNGGVRGMNHLVALRAINKGEEITYDYSTVVGKNAENESDWYMKCRCGAEKCRKKIGNWLTISPARLRSYDKKNALPDFVRLEAVTFKKLP